MCATFFAFFLVIDGLLHFHKHVCGGSVDVVWDALDRVGMFDHTRFEFASNSKSKGVQALCPQADELFPVKNKAVWEAFGKRLVTDEFKNKAIAWLSGAVRIP